MGSTKVVTQDRQVPVLNLYKTSLTLMQESMLSKGRSLTTNQNMKAFKLNVDTYKFMQQLHLKCLFSPLNRSSTSYISKDPTKKGEPQHSGPSPTPRSFSKPSSFVLHTHISPLVTLFGRLVENEWETVYKKNDQGPQYHNLPPAERQALKDLQENKDMVIKPKDKGGAIVVMDMSYYNSENGKHLKMSCSYQPLHSGPIASLKSEIDSMLQHASHQNWITKREYEFLNVTYPVTPVIYSLLKVHKNLTQPSRIPMISDRISHRAPFEIQRFFFLEVMVLKLPSFLKDTKDLLNCLNDGQIDSDVLLVTLDVASLYTFIAHAEGLQSIAKFLKSRDNSVNPPDYFLLELLRLGGSLC